MGDMTRTNFLKQRLMVKIKFALRLNTNNQLLPAVREEVVAGDGDDVVDVDGRLDSVRPDVPGLHLRPQGRHLTPREHVGG